MCVVCLMRVSFSISFSSCCSLLLLFVVRCLLCDYCCVLDTVFVFVLFVVCFVYFALLCLLFVLLFVACFGLRL